MVLATPWHDPMAESGNKQIIFVILHFSVFLEVSQTVYVFRCLDQASFVKSSLWLAKF